MSTPKPVRKMIKKASAKHRKSMEEKGEVHKQFGSPSKQDVKKQLKSHEGRLKKKFKSSGSIAPK